MQGLGDHLAGAFHRRGWSTSQRALAPPGFFDFPIWRAARSKSEPRHLSRPDGPQPTEAYNEAKLRLLLVEVRPCRQMQNGAHKERPDVAMSNGYFPL